MKILALDLGDKWVGTAISDALKITCKPYKTIELQDIKEELEKIFDSTTIETIVIGYPKTKSGTESDQTKKVVKQKEELEQHFKSLSDLKWVLWDERLSSKRAEQRLPGKDFKQERLKSHSIAAAFILQSYLDHLSIHKNLT